MDDLDLPSGWHLDHRATTGSTNADAAQAARDGAAHGLVVLADAQTAGRGRLDRAWTSEPGAGLTVSVLLRPPLRTDLGWVPLVAGLAVLDALPGVAAGLKWPNDVLVGGRKLAGLLAEAVVTDAGTAVVVGLGLNLTVGPLDTATTVAEAGGDADRATVLAAWTTALDDWLGRLATSPAAVRQSYRDRCVTLGAEVVCSLPGDRRLHGTAVDVDTAGRLVVRAGGHEQAVAAGDVVHVRGPGAPEA